MLTIYQPPQPPAKPIKVVPIHGKGVELTLVTGRSSHSFVMTVDEARDFAAGVLRLCREVESNER